MGCAHLAALGGVMRRAESPLSCIDGELGPVPRGKTRKRAVWAGTRELPRIRRARSSPRRPIACRVSLSSCSYSPSASRPRACLGNWKRLRNRCNVAFPSAVRDAGRPRLSAGSRSQHEFHLFQTGDDLRHVRGVAVEMLGRMNIPERSSIRPKRQGCGGELLPARGYFILAVVHRREVEQGPLSAAEP